MNLAKKFILKCALVNFSYPFDVVSQRVTLDDLLGLVPVDDGLQAVESPPTHDIANALLLDAKPLDLVVYVEEEGVIAGRVIRRAD